MRSRLAVPLLLAAIALPAQAQDVSIYSRSSAVDMLNTSPVAEATPEPSGVCPKDYAPAQDGTCVPSRAFTLNRNPRTAPSASPQLASPRFTGPQPARAAPPAVRPGARAPTARLATPRPAPARGSEVPLQFATGSFALSPQSMANLRTLAATLNERDHRGKRIRITGHTDRAGSEEINRRLSQQRAQAAADYLVSRGVPRSRIDTVGEGYDAPLPDLSPYNSRQRRIEVIRVQ